VAEKIAELAIMNAQSRLKTGKKVVRKKIVSGPLIFFISCLFSRTTRRITFNQKYLALS
jgi:hypothetical protein